MPTPEDTSLTFYNALPNVDLSLAPTPFAKWFASCAGSADGALVCKKGRSDGDAFSFEWGYGVQNGYIVYGEHASMIAEQFCKTRDVVRSAENTEIITLNRTLFEAVLKEYLLDSTAFKIEIYEESFGGWLLKK